jgi:peroxiredoxin
MATQISIAASNTFIGTQTISTKIYNYGYYPLIKGDKAPVSTLNKDLFISLQHFFDLQQPLVLVFYSGILANHSSLGALSDLQLKVQEGGGNLLIITNDASRGFKKRISQLNNLTVFFDLDSEIAEQFGLFDYTNPLSNWLSGIEDVSASLPALYVIAPDREIVFQHVDYQFNFFTGEKLSKVIVNQLVDAVNTLSTSYTYLSVWRNQLVS